MDISLVIANRMEKESKLNESLEILFKMFFSSTQKELKNLAKMNIDRILLQYQAKINEFWVDPKIVLQHKKNPYSYKKDTQGLRDDELPPLISVTTINNRLSSVLETLKTIRNQTMEPHSVNLYISESPYLLDSGIDLQNKILDSIFKMGVNIYSVPNIGPYRKQIPIIYQLKLINSSKNTPFITIDDDVLYPDNIIEILFKGSNLSKVVAHRGREMLVKPTGFENYKKFRVPQKQTDILNLGIGKNGILYRLGFFSNILNEYIGPLIAPTADDLWCKWITAVYGIPTTVLEPMAAFDPKFDFKNYNPEDKFGLFYEYNSKGKNDQIIILLEYYFLYNLGFNISLVHNFSHKSVEIR